MCSEFEKELMEHQLIIEPLKNEFNSYCNNLTIKDFETIESIKLVLSIIIKRKERIINEDKHLLVAFAGFLGRVLLYKAKIEASWILSILPNRVGEYILDSKSLYAFMSSVRWLSLEMGTSEDEALESLRDIIDSDSILF
jgi:hypothetical protein